MQNTLEQLNGIKQHILLWEKQLNRLRREFQKARCRSKCMLVGLPGFSFWIGRFWPLGVWRKRKTDGTSFLLLKCGLVGFLFMKGPQ